MAASEELFCAYSKCQHYNHFCLFISFQFFVSWKDAIVNDIAETLRILTYIHSIESPKVLVAPNFGKFDMVR